MTTIKCADCRKEVEKHNWKHKYCKNCAKKKKKEWIKSYMKNNREHYNRLVATWRKDNPKKWGEINKTARANFFKKHGMSKDTYEYRRRKLQLQYLVDRLEEYDEAMSTTDGSRLTTDYWIQSSKDYAEDQLKRRNQNV